MLSANHAAPVSLPVGPETYPGDGPTITGGRARRNIAYPNELITHPAPKVKTLYDLMQQAVKDHGPKLAFGCRSQVRVHEEETTVTKMIAGTPTPVKKSWKYFELGPFNWISYREVGEWVDALGAGLVALGASSTAPAAAEGEPPKVTLFAATSREWIVMAHACFRQGMPITTAYDTLGEAGLVFSLLEGQVATLFTNADLLPTVANVAGQVPCLKYVVYTGKADQGVLDGIAAKQGSKLKLIAFQDLMALGKANPVPPTPPAPADIACIMYTSGSQGTPRASC